MGDELVPGATSAADVLRILELIENAGAVTWVAGGWGVDALIGEQTRDHRDLDVLIPYEKAIAVYESLRSASFHLTTDWFPVRYEMIDDARSVVDVHPIRRLEGGGAELELLERGPWRYSAEALAGDGVVGGRQVRCLSAAEQVRTHVGYEPTAIDVADMRLLAERHGLELPPTYLL